MALFPAYSDDVKARNSENIVEECSEKKNNSEWLKNSSFQEIATSINSNAQNEDWTDSSDEDLNEVIIKNKNETVCENKIISIKRKSKLKDLSTKKKTKSTYKSWVKNLYFEDKDRNNMFLKIETLGQTVRPIYNSCTNSLGFTVRKKVKLKHFRRYHVKNLDIVKKLIKNDIVLKNEKSLSQKEEIIEQMRNFKFQEEQKEIEHFNRKLTESPKDINMWLEYISFQDKIEQVLPFHTDLDNVKKQTIEKKLSIIEKGLASNHNSCELLQMKLNLMVEIMPADQFFNKIEIMIQKDPKNIILWQGLIMVAQTSCALCKVSTILNLYVKCFPVLKQKSKIDSKFYDEQVLTLLYECLTFLRHAGLWEQMWEIIRINLCLNLTLHHETFRNIESIDEKALMHMEEVVLNSKLPLNQLWLRIESLRENFHWITVDAKKMDISLIGDEKRLVSSEETRDFVYPTMSRESNFHLVILSLLSLKIPLLPTRHCTLEDYKLKEHFWTIDSLEFIIPLIYPNIWIGERDKHLSNETVVSDILEGKLTSGPQYLKFHPAQEQYLNFIRLVFTTTVEKLPQVQRTSVLIWWLRFERLLIFFRKSDPLQDENQNKRMKSIVKNFLKNPENRNNLHFYREYALIEYELGNLNSCLQMLKTIIQSQDISSLNNEEKAALFSLYRTIFEILLNADPKQNSYVVLFQEMAAILEVHMSTIFGYTQHITAKDILYNEILKFLTNSATDEEADTFLLPNIYCDMSICYAFLLEVENNEVDNILDILDLFDRCLVHCKNCPRLQERFYEAKIAFLQHYQYKMGTVDTFLAKTVADALEKFSCNVFILYVNSVIESELPYWKLKTRNARMNIWSVFAVCLAGRARITYLKKTGLEDTFRAMVNKMLSFYKVVTKMKKIQSCPLIWKLYMLLLQEYNLCEKKGEEICYEAIAQCPWARSVYISTAEIAPQILPQIQDLIKEKELRMHVTPEELDILRG